MAELSKQYDPSQTETKWYSFWLDNNYFVSTPDEREPYCIVIPPPNVTGVLHMGHMLNNTIQDVLIRRARLNGFNALWVPGTDHASIATEAKVVGKLRDQGVRKTDLGRDKFLEEAWNWTHEHGGIILEQLKRLGASCDWSRTKFTMDDDLYESVIHVFVDLYNKGRIYRGYRMVNWDPVALTAVSDEEVIHKEVQGKLYYVKYRVVDSDKIVTIATTRPETIMADTGLAIHPNDGKYDWLRGKKVIVPLVNREIPVIEDDYIDPEFGTGALKVTPAHDSNDYELGKKHDLESIDILNPNGTLNDEAQVLVGMDRFKARKEVVKLLEEAGNLEKVEDYDTKVGYSERSDAVIEPRLSLQWFLEMPEISEPALKAVLGNEVDLIPGKFENTYRHWMENVHDWCISRQLWWGHQIPAYFYGDGDDDFVVANTAEEALKLAHKKSGNSDLQVADLKQDEDVLDTWFSSWLWPISVFNGILDPDNKDIEYYYPTRDLVTAPEILFFWVARMIIAGYEYRNEKPFNKVYLTGIVRDKLGRKMSKQLGNSPDPIGLIEKYGADGVRVGMLLTSPAGNDLPFDESLCEQGRNFLNKIWNSYRLIKSWKVEDKEVPKSSEEAMLWFEHNLSSTLQKLEGQFEQYRISEALMNVYKLTWDDYCSWYLEVIKPPFGESIDQKTYDKTIEFLESLLVILHPFTPFITEEIWQDISKRDRKDALIISSWPVAKTSDAALLKGFAKIQQIASEIRVARSKNGLSPKEALTLVSKQNIGGIKSFGEALKKLTNLEEIIGSQGDGSHYTFMVGPHEFSIPLGGDIDLGDQVESIRSELDYTKGFLKGVMKKLSNERFVQNAPAQVVELERKKQADAEAKIDALEKQLESLT